MDSNFSVHGRSCFTTLAFLPSDPVLFRLDLQDNVISHTTQDARKERFLDPRPSQLVLRTEFVPTFAANQETRRIVVGSGKRFERTEARDAVAGSLPGRVGRGGQPLPLSVLLVPVVLEDFAGQFRR